MNILSIFEKYNITPYSLIFIEINIFYIFHHIDFVFKVLLYEVNQFYIMKSFP